MALPKEPRQKMINLMYLVLTALLALNVSAEILNAFKTVERSLTHTNETIDNSTETIITSLQDKLKDPGAAAKAQIWTPKAMKVQQWTNNVYSYIDDLKKRILVEAGFDPAKNGDSSFKQDNQDIATRMLVEGEEGKKLFKMLSDYRDSLLKIDPIIAKEFQNTLQVDLSIPPVQNKSNKTWQSAYFYMVPTVAATTMLSKFQNDIKTSENRVVAFMHEQVGKVEVKFDAFEAIVGQNSKYLMPGQELEITAGLGAFSKSKLPNVSIGGNGIGLNEKGMAVWKTTAGSIGSHTIPVTVSFTDQDGKPQTRTYNVEYTVGQSATSIALDKMNVLYIGVDNPVTIAASGGAEQIQASITQGSLTKVGPGKYVARVNTQTDDCRIVVNVAGKTAGQQVFRVRSIPDPVATVGGYNSGDNVPAGAFKAQAGVGAFIKDFPFDLKYNVVSFTMTGDGEGFEDIMEATVQGNAWNAQAQGIIRRVRAGSFITIENIRAMGPDGRTRKLGALLYNIK